MFTYHTSLCKIVRSLRIFSLSLLIPSLSLVISGCGVGGGGGGDGASGPAEVSLSVSPTTVDIADNTTITIRIDGAETENLALKLRFPKELKYVLDSSYLSLGKSKKNIDPDVHISDADDTYLVYYIGKSRLDKDGSGEVLVSLKVSEQVAKATIAVDVDVDDPEIDNATEFAVGTPNFEAVDKIDIKIRDA